MLAQGHGFIRAKPDRIRAWMALNVNSNELMGPFDLNEDALFRYDAEAFHQKSRKPMRRGRMPCLIRLSQSDARLERIQGHRQGQFLFFIFQK